MGDVLPSESGADPRLASHRLVGVGPRVERRPSQDVALAAPVEPDEMFWVPPVSCSTPTIGPDGSPTSSIHPARATEVDPVDVVHAGEYTAPPSTLMIAAFV